MEIVVGSGNLAAGGLNTNYEGGIVITLELVNSEQKKFQSNLYFLLDSRLDGLNH